MSAVLNKPISSRPARVLSPPQTTEKPWGELVENESGRPAAGSGNTLFPLVTWGVGAGLGTRKVLNEPTQLGGKFKGGEDL